MPLNPLTIQQQARMAIKRFVIGIVNQHLIFDNFQLPQDIGNAAFNNVVTPYATRALNNGGYDTVAAQFLFALINGNFPNGILGNIQNPHTGIGVVLHLNERVSKNIKEIHWNSLPVLPINQTFLQAVNDALGGLQFALFVYNTIKGNINNIWVQLGVAVPNSATIIHFTSTSQD